MTESIFVSHLQFGLNMAGTNHMLDGIMVGAGSCVTNELPGDSGCGIGSSFDQKDAPEYQVDGGNVAGTLWGGL